jgi:hypothetical protein
MKEIILKNTDADLRAIAEAVLDGKRLTTAEALTLYDKADLSLLAALATWTKKAKSGDAVFFNRNFHIEPYLTAVSAHTISLKVILKAGSLQKTRYLI